MSEDKQNKEVKKEEKKEEKKMRQIIIETDGNTIKITKTEVAGKIELIAILENVVNYLKKD